MDVKVTLNGSNITSHVINYSREHKICTGIGMLEMEISTEFSGSIDPWDKVVIFENGEKNGEYYVSSTSDGQPGSTIAIVAQDNSKRLADYFISDYYQVDYPSYASFWIKYFLDEVGIKSRFVSGDPGTLLSNNTALGLMSAYEQIMYLLQLNGWYITFDYNGVAIIGKLTTDWGTKKGGFNNRDILDIKTVKTDSMLRNRVVVWGNGDPTTDRWVFADVYKPTKWDYDKKDRRTIVISNSNVRKVKDAFWLANKALLEFKNITLEKHLTLEGARNLLVGDIVSVQNKIFTGKGKITTFGTSMSKDGLITNIVLDERCPRLFAFWDMGGFVYAGTFGDGVWRKHILPAWSGSPTGSGLIGFASGIFNVSGWYDYSSGLKGEDLKVTDLHVSAGMLVCVTASGKAFYSLEDEHPWSGIPISGLRVAISGSMALDLSGNVVDSGVYSSGLMARACIIDRDTNFIRLGVDTRSGENLGDFLMETDPFTGDMFSKFAYITPSGISPNDYIQSGMLMRSWVLDVNGYSGSVVGSYPIGVSGNYNFWVYDIENDGTHDYVEVMTLGSGDYPYISNNGQYNGHAVNDMGFVTALTDKQLILGRVDSFGTIRNTLPYSGFVFPETQGTDSYKVSDIVNITNFRGTMYLEDNYPFGEVIMATCRGNTITGNLELIIKKLTTSIDGSMITPVTYTKQSTIKYLEAFPIAIFKLGLTKFRLVFKYSKLSSFASPIHMCIMDYDFFSGTSTEQFIDDVFILKDEYSSSLGKELCVGTKYYVIGYRSIPVGAWNSLQFLEKTINLMDGSSSMRSLFTIRQKALIKWSADDSSLLPGDGEDYVYYCPVARQTIVPDTASSEYEIYRFYKNGGTFTFKKIYDHYNDFGDIPNTYSFNISMNEYKHNNTDYRFILAQAFSPPISSSSVTIYDTIVDMHVYYPGDPSDTSGIVTDNMYLNRFTSYGIGKIPVASGYSNFVLFDAKIAKKYGELDLTPISQPLGYYLGEFMGIDSINNEFYFMAYSGTPGTNVRLVSMPYNGFGVSRVKELPTASLTIQMRGNFRITENNIYWEKPDPIPIYYPAYFVLQRDNYDFAVVKSGLFRDRLDISNYSPMLTMDRRVSSLETYYISSDNNVLVTSNPSMTISGIQASGSVFSLGIVADDFRYAGIDNAIESGYATTIFIVASGALNSLNADTLDALSGYFSTTSGSVTRLETSNYCLPDQYIFVAVSGYIGASGSAGIIIDTEEHFEEYDMYGDVNYGAFGFFQKNPTSGIYGAIPGEVPSTWVDYSSGYPQARTTIIRLDDSI